jgi:hypothetical protein
VVSFQPAIINPVPFTRGLPVHIKRYLPLSLFVFFAACPGDSTSPGDSSSFSFNYSGSGVGTGAFSASGTMPANASSLNNHDAAGAAQSADFDSYEVLAAHARGSGAYDIGGILTGRLTAGSTDLDASCDPQTTNCAEVLFIKNGSFTGVTLDQFCVLATGTVTVTEVTATRLKGTFGGIGGCVDDQGQNPTSITVTNGTFDVAIASQIPDLPNP